MNRLQSREEIVRELSRVILSVFSFEDVESTKTDEINLPPHIGKIIAEFCVDSKSEEFELEYF